jgi:hypothetical protein
MDMSGKLHDPAALPPGKEPLVLIGYEVGGPQPVLAAVVKRNIPSPAGNWTLIYIYIYIYIMYWYFIQWAVFWEIRKIQFEFHVKYRQYYIRKYEPKSNLSNNFSCSHTAQNLMETSSLFSEMKYVDTQTEGWMVSPTSFSSCTSHIKGVCCLWDWKPRPSPSEQNASRFKALTRIQDENSG